MVAVKIEFLLKQKQCEKSFSFSSSNKVNNIGIGIKCQLPDLSMSEKSVISRKRAALWNTDGQISTCFNQIKLE